MSRAAISVDRVEFNPVDNTLTVYERKDRPSSGRYRTYTIMEFMALLAAHIPSRPELVSVTVSRRLAVGICTLKGGGLMVSSPICLSIFFELW